tara:strand:+ start:135 stop:707 length:573 start_codon:yes stop_codon:yes gene_type:complete
MSIGLSQHRQTRASSTRYPATPHEANTENKQLPIMLSLSNAKLSVKLTAGESLTREKINEINSSIVAHLNEPKTSFVVSKLLKTDTNCTEIVYEDNIITNGSYRVLVRYLEKAPITTARSQVEKQIASSNANRGKINIHEFTQHINQLFTTLNMLSDAEQPDFTYTPEFIRTLETLICKEREEEPNNQTP